MGWNPLGRPGASRMTTELVYEITRNDVHTDKEALLERVQVFSKDGMLWRRVDDGPETSCPGTDVAAVIGADPLLNEIRANQVTRITAESAALAELPFVLQVPGHRDDFDESLWSEAMSDEHATREWVVQPGVYRVLYVNGERWSAWPTAEGERMLPEDWPLIRLTPCWGRLSFCENGSMVSGEDETNIGLVTPNTVACATLMDPGIEAVEEDVVLWRRGNTAMDDARMFVEWLLDGGLVPHYYPGDPQLQAMLAQLFVEASTDDCNGAGVPGSRLVAGTKEELGSGTHDSSEWTLELDLAPEVVDAVLDVLAERSPRLGDIVTAARDPDSPAGLARRAALNEWSEYFEAQAWSEYYEPQDWQQES